MQRRSRAELTPPWETDPAPAWTRIRTPSPEITYAPWSQRAAALPPFVLAAPANLEPQQMAGSEPQRLLQQQQHLQQWGMLFLPSLPAAVSGKTAGDREEAKSTEAAGEEEDGHCFDPEDPEDAKAHGSHQWLDDFNDERGAAGDAQEEDPPEDSVATPRLGPMAQVESIAAPSRGSVGHPNDCGAPCKYVRKKRGCKDGADCSHCHLCVWHSHRTRLPRGAHS